MKIEWGQVLIGALIVMAVDAVFLGGTLYTSVKNMVSGFQLGAGSGGNGS